MLSYGYMALAWGIGEGLAKIVWIFLTVGCGCTLMSTITVRAHRPVIWPDLTAGGHPVGLRPPTHHRPEDQQPGDGELNLGGL